MLETMNYLTNGSVAGLLLLCSISATADNQNPDPAPKVIVKKFETIESTSGEVSSKVAARLRTYGIDLDNIEAELDTVNADGRRIVIVHSDENSASTPLATKIFSDRSELHPQDRAVNIEPRRCRLRARSLGKNANQHCGNAAKRSM
jgi:hypothetical protein